MRSPATLGPTAPIKPSDAARVQARLRLRTIGKSRLGRRYEAGHNEKARRREAQAGFDLVAGAGSNLHLLPEQVKMVAGTGIDHNLQSTPVKMVAGGRTHHNLLSDGRPMMLDDVRNLAKQVAAVAGTSSAPRLLFRAAT